MESELVKLSGLCETISLVEVAEVYLSLCQLINIHYKARHELFSQIAKIAENRDPSSRVPFVIGIAGSVAVGKSTIARLLQTLLSRWHQHARVDLIPTDGFLFPNAELKKRGLLERKGFPESYCARSLLNFLAAVKAGQPSIRSPVYSHLHYDILPEQYNHTKQPDILIVEGLNLLQKQQRLAPNVSDFIDFSIYVDASPQLIETWYCQRFLKLRETAFRVSSSYFHHYARLSEKEALKEAKRIWQSINLVNLLENIQPTKQSANLILEKRNLHSISHIHLRKI